MCLKQVNSFSSAGKSVIWCFWSVCVFWRGLLLRFSFSIPSLSVIPSTLLSLVVEITVTLLRTFRTNINTNTHTKKKTPSTRTQLLFFSFFSRNSLEG